METDYREALKKLKDLVQDIESDAVTNLAKIVKTIRDAQELLPEADDIPWYSSGSDC